MAQTSPVPQHDKNQLQEKFSKIITQLAGQLWQSKLQETLQDPQLQQHLTPQECSGITTYEQLFNLILAKDLVSPYDLTLLKQILNNHASGHSLLWAVYEAGFGQLGLHRANSSSDNSPKLEESSLTDSLRSTCSNVSTTSTGRRTSNSDCKSPIFCRTFCKPQAGTREFKQLLRNINVQIDSREDLGALKLLCSEVLSHRQVDSINTALELFSALKRQRCMTTKKPEFLYRILQDCGRWDLSDLVDGYVYVCLRKGSASQVPASEDEEESSEKCFSASKKTVDRRRSYQFVRSLKLLGDELGHDDLATMKMLAVTWIPDSKLEKVSNVYEFFILLLERGKLSQDNLSFLEHLLYDKLHVIHPLYELGFGRKTKSLPKGAHLATHTSHLPVYTLFSSDQDQVMMNFRRLLKTIGSSLTSDNIRDIKYLCPDEMGSLSNVKSGLELLLLLEKWQEIEPTNVTFLLDSLEEIGRKDLCTIVVLYQNSSKTSLKSIQTLASGTSTSTLVEEPAIEILERVQSLSPDQTTPTDSCQGDIVTAHAQSLATEVRELQEQLGNVQASMQKERDSEIERTELTTKLLECNIKYNKELEKNTSLQEDLIAHQKLITKLTEEAQQQKAAISTVEHKMEVQDLQMRAREAECQLVEKKTKLELLEKDLQIDELTKKLDSQELLLKTLAKRCGIRLIK